MAGVTEASEAPEKEAKEAQKRIPPTEMFKSQTDKFSKFDEKVKKVLTLMLKGATSALQNSCTFKLWNPILFNCI